MVGGSVNSEMISSRWQNHLMVEDQLMVGGSTNGGSIS
jgi:hypothetical protein